MLKDRTREDFLLTKFQNPQKSANYRNDKVLPYEQHTILSRV